MALAVLLILALAQTRQRPPTCLLTFPTSPSTTFFLPSASRCKRPTRLRRRALNDAEASGQLGMVLDAYEQYDSAEACYRRAHLLDVRSFRWLYLLGWVQEAQGRHEEAAASLGGAVRIENETPRPIAAGSESARHRPVGREPARC